MATLMQTVLCFFISSFLLHAAEMNVLRLRTLGDPLTFDWNRAFTPIEATLIRNMMEGLVAIGPKMNVMPALAQRWQISLDQKRYTFYLRKDVKWTDGKQLKAQDFVQSWKRLLSPDFSANYAYLLFDIVNAEAFSQGKIKDFSAVGVKALNDFTLEVQLRSPIAYWIWLPTFWSTFPIRHDLIQKHGPQWSAPEHLVTLGAYALKTYEPNRKVILKKNPSYYGIQGNIDEISAALVTDDATAIRMYNADQLDFITQISSNEAKKLQKRKDFQRWPEAKTLHLNFNPNQGPTSDVKLRKAIAMAIDREKLSKVIISAYEAADSFIPPGLLSHSNTKSLATDVRKAQLLLKESPQKKANLTLDLVTVEYTDEIMVAQFIQSELKKNLGLTVRIHTYSPKQFYSPLVSLSGFSMILNRWTADYPDADNFYSIFLSHSGNNRVRWKNPKYDELILTARSLAGQREREKLYIQAHHILTQTEAVALPLYYGKNGALVRPTIEGFRPTPTNSYLFKDFYLHETTR